MEENSLIRINKYLSEIGFCSRRRADDLIEQGRVKVNGKLAVMGEKISGREEIRVNNKVVKKPEKKKGNASSQSMLQNNQANTEKRIRIKG